MIDTLFLSGGSSKGFAYIGLFKYLIDEGIFENIKNIISCSIGSFVAIMMSININHDLLITIMINIKLNYDIDHINIDNLFNQHGLFKNVIFYSIFKYLFKYKYGVEKLTLKELYDHTGINHEIKVYNYTKRCGEYYNHINHPNIDVALLITAATSIPLINEYVIYNGDYLLDGGINGSYPFLNKKMYKNYIGIKLSDNCNHDSNDIFDLIQLVFINASDETANVFINNNKRIITIYCKGIQSMLNFELSNDMIQNLINIGYDTIKQYVDNNKKLFTK
jgi:hypothetical protein